MITDLLSMEEGAKVLGISLFTMRAWAFQRKFPTVKLGRRRLIQREALEKFVTRNIVPAVGESRNN